MAHSTSTVVGANFSRVTTDAEFAVGDYTQGNDGSAWMYVQANGAITQYDWVGVDENFQAGALTAAMAGDGWSVGVAQIAFADNEYGWVAVKGHNITARVGASCAADVVLYTTATAGVLDDATGTRIDGVVAVTANSATSIASTEVLMTYPRSSSF
jgi:hypothetical protein